MPESISNRNTFRIIRIAGPIAAAGALCASVGCVEAKRDFDEFVARSAQIRGETLDDSGLGTGPAHVMAPSAGFSGVYFVGCLSALLPETDAMLRFVTTVTYTSNGSNGSLAMSMTPLKSSATTVAKENRSGPEVSASGVAVSDGAFELHLGTVELSAEANSIGHIPGGVADAVLYGKLTMPPEAFCAGLAGTTYPVPVTLEKGKNTCIFRKVDSPSGAVPTLAISEFRCP